MTVADFLNVDISESLELIPKKKGERKKKGQKNYWNVVCAFDIETTSVEVERPVLDEDGEPLKDVDGDPVTDKKPHSFMYVWQCQIGTEYTIVGRTWRDYRDLLKHLKVQQLKACKRLGITSDLPYYVFFVHNLAYEWQFLQGQFIFNNEDCFFRDARKPIYCRHFHLIEYRCSYLHCNMTLAKFGEQMGATVRKLDGAKFDYSKIRFPWTSLTDYEMQYCINDVKTLVESIMIEMERDGDTLKTLPLTSTGYVRRDMKKALAAKLKSFNYIKPDLYTYNLLRRCFRGGDTHANRYRVGVIQGAGYSVDIESSYPFTLATDSYPMGPFRKLEDDERTIERIVKLIAQGNAVIGDWTFKNIRLKNPREPIPYLSIAKCKPFHAVEDNGRILSADLITTALTEIDLKIVLAQYDYDKISVHNAMTAIKGPLPREARETVIEYYKRKTMLRGVEGKHYEYMKSKNKLNSCYGMMAQQSIHPEVIYKERLIEEPYIVHTPEDEAAENELKQAPFPYQWGVYCTAWARFHLREGMKLIPDDENGISRIIYCDTDSIKYVGEKIDFTSLNRRIKRTSEKSGAVAYDSKGKMRFMGKFDKDGEFTRFLTQGAKRYAYEDIDGELHVTVSGVTDKPVSNEDLGRHPELSPADVGNEWKIIELGKLENFKQGMIWNEAGGTAAIYHDTDNFDYTDPETGKTVRITPNVTIVDSTYEMIIDQDYSDLLDMCALWLKFCEETGRKYK